MKFINIIIIAFSILNFFFYGCFGGGSSAGSNYVPPTEAQIEANQELSEINSKILVEGSSSGPASPADYIIGPSDLLEIEVFESERLSDKNVRVSSNGMVTLPLLGSVEVGGLSSREAETKIQYLLKENEYIYEPHVSVFVAEYKSKLVSIVGAVQAPGTYELLGRKTLLDALANAQGLTPNAGRSAHITRQNNDGSRQTYIVDVDKLLEDGNPELNIPIHPGDVIFVPQTGVVFVEGAVHKVGTVPIREGDTTLSQAIAQSGGLASYADDGDITIIRYLGSGGREIIKADLDDIRDGRAPDVLLKERDAIIVGASTVKQILYGLRLSLGFGLVGVGYDPPEK